MAFRFAFTKDDRAIIIKPTNEQILVEPENKTDFTLEEVQKIVGGYVELVRLVDTPKFVMLVNEDGLSACLLPNNLASLIYRYSTIYGTVLICRKEMFR